MDYGYCKCGATVVSRTRGIPPIDTCRMGHVREARHTLAVAPRTSMDDLVHEKAKASKPGPVIFIDKIAEAENEIKFVSPCPPPTPHESELLDILIEECAEVIQRATKMKRFGVKETESGQPFNNAERLSFEVGDLIAVMDRCVERDLITHRLIETQIPKKISKLDKYMQTTREDKK